MAVQIQVIGPASETEGVVAILGEPLEMVWTPREYEKRKGVPGVRRYGQVRPRVRTVGTELAVFEGVVADIPVVYRRDEAVRVRLTGDEPEILGVLLAMLAVRAQLLLRFPPELFEQKDGFGVKTYLHLYPGQVQETGAEVVVAERQPPRSRWVPSDRADRKRLPGRRRLDR